MKQWILNKLYNSKLKMSMIFPQQVRPKLDPCHGSSVSKVSEPRYIFVTIAD